MTVFAEPQQAIDWYRMAEPQADGYDTAVTLGLATSTGSRLRPLPYRRREIADAHAFCDGAVAVRPAPPRGLMSDKIVPAPVDHPNLTAAAAYLSRWPAAYTQFKALVDTVYPYTDPVQAGRAAVSLGSSSHSYEEEFGSLHVTVDNALGLAQALIHEMAHQKLRALGVSFESADRLIANDPAQRFVSPIRKDQPRPMTAVFHAQYSFIHVTALDLWMLAMEQKERDRQHILMLLARNVPRMEAGFAEIAAHIRTDESGHVFVRSFMDWSREVLARGREQLDANGYDSPP